LAPLADDVDTSRLRALTIAVAAVCGIEVYVWLKDISGLTDEHAADLQRWIAEVLLLGGLADNAPATPETNTALSAIRSRVEGHDAT
jgi:hypothetical protein